jgi:alanine dehydrogenase
VASSPADAREFLTSEHEVLVVERDAGTGLRFPDQCCESADARIVGDEADVWSEGELLHKVNEPIAPACGLLHERPTLFTDLHLAPNRPLTEALLGSVSGAITSETVEKPDGRAAAAGPHERDRRALSSGPRTRRSTTARRSRASAAGARGAPAALL